MIDETDVLDLCSEDEIFDYLYNHMGSDGILDCISFEEIEKYYKTNRKNNKLDEDDFMNEISLICRSIQPKGFIGKEDAKKILCDYIDFQMNKAINTL